MVLGLKTRNRKSASVQLDYLIHIQDIKPWPPSQSLRTLRSALIQWEHGEKSSGSTNQVAPSLGSGVGDGKIEFNETFKLPVTLIRETPINGGEGEIFQKSCIEFSLYEPRRDKTGQLLATAQVDLADYWAASEILSINASMNCTRTFRNTAQPVLFLKIQAVEKRSATSLLRDRLPRGTSVDKNGGESVSALMKEEYAEEAEITSSTDDDVSSHSSLIVSSPALELNGGSLPQKQENGSDATENNIDEHILGLKHGLAKSDEKPVAKSLGSQKGGSSSSSSTDLSMLYSKKKTDTHSVQFSSSSMANEGTQEELTSNTSNNDNQDLSCDIQERIANGGSEIRSITQRYSNNDSYTLVDDKFNPNSVDSLLSGDHDGKAWPLSMNAMHEAAIDDAIQNRSTEDDAKNELQENIQKNVVMEETRHHVEYEHLNTYLLDVTTKQVSQGSDTYSVIEDNPGSKGNNRLKHVKSVRSPLDSSRNNGSVKCNPSLDLVKDGSPQEHAHTGVRNSLTTERKDSKYYTKETRNIFSDSKIQKLEHRIKVLEGELREAAGVEVGVYSVVAEHASSRNKLHAPARRLSRLYIDACKENYHQSRKANAARSAVSGLVLVAKACGNDVPRLTFWLSNSIVLRAIITQAFGDQHLPPSAQPSIVKVSDGKGNKKLSALKWESSPNKNSRSSLHEIFYDWEDLSTFLTALERIESWIFSRIIESIWWQILAPCMQSTAALKINSFMGSDTRNLNRRTSSSTDQEQGSFSMELWNNAFREACERICPIRAGGHECGCLPMLSRLIMEQCVARLDVAMFNAILRDSSYEIPTDPVSDPISDPKVLPIPAGKASFGAGAQLKNAIGNWSRWLTGLFGIDDEPLEDENDLDHANDERKECETSFKPFHLLNALSNLMMLPKDMLLSRSIRKEVCPTFGVPLIRRVIRTFAPDEFCPDPIPHNLLQALNNTEDPSEAEEDSVVNFPCAAAPVVYLPPSADSVAGMIGDKGNQSRLRRSGSSVLKKSYTSDDELDELDSPLTSIITKSLRSSHVATKSSCISKQSGCQNSIRYQLLREVWKNSQ